MQNQEGKLLANGRRVQKQISTVLGQTGHKTKWLFSEGQKIKITLRENVIYLFALLKGAGTICENTNIFAEMLIEILGFFLLN